MAAPLPRALRRLRPSPAWVDAAWSAVPAWLAARAVVGLAFVVALVAVDHLRGGERTLQLEQGLLAWDGAWYHDIAAVGYDDLRPEALRFFPLVPLLARALSVLLGGRVDVALVLVANAAALATGLLLYRLAVAERADARLAARAAWVVALLPPAFVLVLGYAESTMMASSVAAFLGLRRHRWGWAVVAGFLAGLARPVGAVLALPAAVEAARDLREVGWAGRAARLGAVAAPVLGTGSYLAWVGWRFGDWDLPYEVQQQAGLRGGFVDPVSRTLEAARGLVGSESLGDGLHLPFIVLLLAAVVVLARRWPASYALYTGVLVVLALSAESLGSFERYGAAAFPVALVLADLTAHPRAERAVLALSGAGLVGFAALAWLGAYVP